MVLLILLSALADPDQYHFSGSELGGEFEFMDDASKYVKEQLVIFWDSSGQGVWLAVFSVKLQILIQGPI